MFGSSLFFSFINSALAWLQTVFYHSMAYRVFRAFADAFETSFSLRVFTGIEQGLKRASEGSLIWKALSKPSALGDFWRHSLLCRILNSPGKLFAAIYSKIGGVFSESVLCRVLCALFGRMEIVLGLSIIAVVAVPDNRWYNMYALILVAAFFALYLLKIGVQGGDTLGVERVDFPFFLFFLTLMLSALTSVLPGSSLNSAVLYSIDFLLALIIVNTLLTEKTILNFSVLLGVAAGVMGLYGIYQWKFVGVFLNTAFVDTRIFSDMQGRVFSTMGNPNILAEALLLTIPFLFSSFFNADTLGKKAFFLILALPPVLCLYLSGCRSAWGAFAVACLVYLFLIDRRLVPFALLLGLSALPLLPIFFKSFYNRLISAFNSNDSSRVYREYIFGQATYMLRDYWATGVGLGIDAFRSVFLNYVNIYYKNVIHTHNSYMQLWLESGICGLASFIWVILRLCKSSLSAVFGGTGKKLKNVSASAAMSLTGILAMGFFDNIWFYNRITMLLFAVIALVISIGRGRLEFIDET